VTVRAYLLRRVLLLVFVLIGISLITFLLARVVPADPAALYAGPQARGPAIAAARKLLHMDQPLYVQYGAYMWDLLHGNWGTSLRTHRAVLGDILAFAPLSLQLVAGAMLLATVVGIALGALTAHLKGGWIDFVMRLFAIGGVSLPSFWLAMMLQILFFRVLHVLPVAGSMSVDVQFSNPITHITGMPLVDSLVTGNFTAFWDSFTHFILPCIALAAYPAGVLMRMTRSSMLEALGQDYIRMAEAMGVPKLVIIYRYALKNSLAPVFTVLGLMFAYSIIGAFFIELIFAWPGLGSYALMSILSLDYPAIMGVTIFIAAVYVVINLIVDLVIAWLDPRIVLS
jgi:peptide/nickel transport system permease protein